MWDIGSMTDLHQSETQRQAIQSGENSVIVTYGMDRNVDNNNNNLAIDQGNSY